MALADKRFIVVHHSLTSDGSTVSWGAIRRYHVETNGWRAIGYHFGIERIGDHVETLLGRQIHEDAAAVKEAQMNRVAVHICIVGNFDITSPPTDVWRAAVALVASLCLLLNVDPSRVSGHRQWALSNGKPYKSCPGNAFDLDLFRRDVVSELARLTAT